MLKRVIIYFNVFIIIRRDAFILKKILLMLLCAVLAFSGCSKQKAETYYNEYGESVSFETEYKYYFTDEKNVFCNWHNGTDKKINFHEVFQLHELGDDGEWYLVGNVEDASFNTKYSFFADPDSGCRVKYDISAYTDKLENGSTYRISTYYYDAEENYYQMFAEFICDDKLAEEEMYEISDGIVGKREEPEVHSGGLSIQG